MKQTVNVFLNKPAAPLKNFWSNIHFHPTDAIEDEWGQAILNDVAKDHAANMVRMYTMFEDIVTQNPDGSLNYDFTLNDIRMDYMVEKGFKLFVSYNFIPPFLASDPNEVSSVSKNKTRYKGKMIVTSAPRDYGIWEDICRTYTQHIVDRYGLERVASWQLQCFNEPDAACFFMRNCTDTAVRAGEYCKLYKGFVRGVKAVSDRLIVGGPALAGIVPFLNYFLEYVNQEKLPLDFVTAHTYGTDPWALNRGDSHLDIHNHLKAIYEYRKTMADNGMEDMPLVLDEWGMSTCGYFNVEECPQLLGRETEMFSAYYGKMLTLFDELQLKMDNMLTCLSGQHEMKVDFSGFRGFFTLHHFPKPFYWGYVLGARLGEKKLVHDLASDQDLAIMPTICDDGTVQILLSYADRCFEPIEDQEITLNLEGLDEACCCAEINRVDKDHANAYRYWQSKGYADEMTPEEIADVKEHAVLVPEEVQLTAAEGKKTLTLTVPCNSLTLVTIRK